MGLNPDLVSSQLADLRASPFPEPLLVFICKMGMLTVRVPLGMHAEYRAEPSKQESISITVVLSVNC